MRYYRLKHRLCMQHSFDNKKEHKHNHVIEIGTVSGFSDSEDDFGEVRKMEMLMEQILEPYQFQYLNDYPEFHGDLSIENIGEVINERLWPEYEKSGWSLQRFEISETPLRVYAIVEGSHE